MSRKPNKPVLPIEPDADDSEDAEEGEEFDFYEYDKQRRAMVKEKLGVTIRLSQVQFTGADGQLITESYTDYSRRTMLAKYPTLESFLNAWFHAESKQRLVVELYHQGVFMDKLQEEHGFDLDGFDVICYLAFDRKPLTRRERASKVRSQLGYFEKYGKEARQVIDMLVTEFSRNGYFTLDNVMNDVKLNIFLNSPPLNKLGSLSKVKHSFGGKEQFRQAMRDLQHVLYQD
jgi:type I restriction enzyme R subunit